MATVHDTHGSQSVDTLSRPIFSHQSSILVDHDVSVDDRDENAVDTADLGPDFSPVADDKTRKRRRSRKGLDKRYECMAEGCGKSYSRAEHLYRHQLNHNSKQIFHCEYPDCSRTFVRGDLLKRHMDRHNVKGSQLNRRGSNTSRAAAVTSPGSLSPDSHRAQAGRESSQSHQGARTQAQQDQEHEQDLEQDLDLDPGGHRFKQEHGHAHGHAHGQGRAHEQATTQMQSQPQLHIQQLSIQAQTRAQAQQAHAQLQAQHASHYTHSSPPLHPTLPPPHEYQEEGVPGTTSASAARYHAETAAAANHVPYGAHSPTGAPLHQRPLHAHSPPTAYPHGRRASVPRNIGHYDIMSSITGSQSYHGHHGHTSPSAGFPHQQQQQHQQPQQQHQQVMPFHQQSSSHYPQFRSPPAPGDGQPAFADTVAAEFPHAHELAMLDHMTMQSADAVLGEEALNKSPYVGMPEDFMVYLFNSLPANGSPSTHPLPPPLVNYGHLNNQYAASHVDENGATTFYLPQQPQHVMAVNNLLDQDAPEASIAEQRSQQLYDFLRERYRESGDDVAQRGGNSLLGGNRSDGDHVLGRRMMQAYLGSYWHHISDQMPILHKPTFRAESTPNLLLLAIMALGAACLERSQGAAAENRARASTETSVFLVERLRWEVFMDPDFRAPAKLWIFQTLILLELYEKMFSTRELHERAHIHHGTTITLMRRGRSLVGKAALELTPVTNRDGAATEGAGKSSSSGVIAHTADEWWSHWITNEATRRAAFAAFVIDSTHATMFGHSAVMVVHEMRLPLPCDELLWRAGSSAEVGRVEASLMARGIKPMAFLEGLKRTLSHQRVDTTWFGRTVLMAGLLSVTYHMHQRDLQVNILGGGVIQALGGRDKWRATLTRAYDSWKADFDAALEQRASSSSDPYGRGAPTGHELSTIADSRSALHHLAHMAMHADIIDCQIYARAKCLLGRSVGAQDFGSAERRIKDYWAPSARARDAAFYALKFLLAVLAPGPDGGGGGGAPSPHARPYNPREDHLINRPWVLYFAALVVWCYGFATEGPCPDAREPRTYQEKWQQTRAYLAKYGGIADPNELREMRGINGTTGLLLVLKDAFEGSRWELLQEGAGLLRNCIILNLGSIV